MIDKLIAKFSEYAINHHKYTEEGDWKKGNTEIRKINNVYTQIKKMGVDAQEKLLQLIYSSTPEVASLAATYCMKYNPKECLAILQSLSEKNIPHISFAAKQAIKNWNNNEWYIE